MGSLPRFQTKPELRSWLLEQRTQMPRSTRQLHDDRLITNTSVWINSQCLALRERGVDRPIVACFAPVDTEPGATGGQRIDDAMQASRTFIDRIASFLPTEATVILPVCPPGPPTALEWVAYDSSLEQPLQASRFGLFEPVGTPLGAEALADAHIILMPGIAGDANGVRMGRGAGYYDRSLELAGRNRADSHTTTALLLHPSELVDSVPFDDHDVPVSAIITAEKVLPIH